MLINTDILLNDRESIIASNISNPTTGNGIKLLVERSRYAAKLATALIKK